MSKHYAQVRIDYDYINRLRQAGITLTNDHWDGAWVCFIVCSDPSDCPGWQECDKNHQGYDPEDEDSPVYDQYEDVMIHGELHNWHDGGFGWTVEYDGCPVQGNPFLDTPDGIPLDRHGTYLLDDDWDDADLYLTLVKEVTPSD